MKYNGYDVYDIIYRNDNTVKGMLENDLMYLKTGFIALQDTDERIWYLYKKTGILVPNKQEYIDRSYGKGDTLPKISMMKIGKDECECSLPDEDTARDFFIGLSKISDCSRWRVEKRLWKILSEGSVLYDAPAKMVRMQQNMDRVTLLRCAYVSDRRTKRRNFTNFSNWKYITAHELTMDGKVVMKQVEDPLTAETAASANSSPSVRPSGMSAAAVTPGIGASRASVSASVPPRASVPVTPFQRTANPGSAFQRTAPQTVTSLGTGTGTAAQETVYRRTAATSVPGVGTGMSASETVFRRSTASNVLGAGMEKAAPSTEPTQTAVRDKSDMEIDSEKMEAASVAAPENTNSTAAQETAPRGKELSAVVMSDSDKPKKKLVTDIKDLLDCDKRRCRLESYEENMLYDIKRGHWDLFESVEAAENPEIGKPVPRDPRKDIRTGVVGIDFGTKSTVVVRQDDTNAIMPIRIGAEVLSACLTESDYENPTIIECTDLDRFIRKYYESPGRPETSCEDFFVSYDAYNDYRSCLPGEFYAYYSDLKQWSNHQKENVLVLDKQRHEYRFGASGSREEKIINPIELYAYYIGLYINNMRNGIYMKYLMSFPVGYSKDTRQLILTSFERGIRKSLPTCILEDEECMKNFSVRLGISEPAAYAVTALDMSDLEPEDENDRYRYGIFDFGGGTADFGFGIWRGASEEEYDVEGYDYVLECFGADSDVTLGGENILELLAYAVFKKNREMARRKRITCSLPFGEQAFLGSEALISNSQIAQRNMSILKEELRPLWHQEPNWEDKYRHEQTDEGGVFYEEYIDLSMYDIDGKKQSDCRFVIDTEELIALIKARIQKGIDAFFKCMSKAFQKEDQQVGPGGEMYIFLAGNSSKSVFVKELFEKAIEDYAYGESSAFVLMEPLNAENKRGYEYVPNAKTSVAYGLIKSREGSSIKVEKNLETDAEEQTRFKYYLGRERRRHFDCKLSPVETEYGSWVRFQGAAKQTVRIYYTTDPTADIKAEPPVIDNIPYREIVIEPQDGAFIFIRTCEPTVIEYVVSFSEERIGGGDEIRRIDFGM